MIPLDQVPVFKKMKQLEITLIREIEAMKRYRQIYDSYLERTHKDVELVNKLIVDPTCPFPKQLEVIDICLSNYLQWIDFIELGKSGGIKFNKDTLAQHEIYIAGLRRIKARIQNHIKSKQQIEAKTQDLLRKIEEMQAQNQQVVKEIIQMQQEKHQRDGNYRILCRIKPPPSNQEKSNVIQRCSDFSIKIKEKVSNHQSKVQQKQLIKHEVSYVFPVSAPQAQVFGHVLYLISSAFEGEICSIICIGQTASGKTYTMTGPKDCLQSLKIDKQYGLVPRILEAAIKMKDKEADKGRSITLKLHFEERCSQAKSKSQSLMNKPKQSPKKNAYSIDKYSPTPIKPSKPKENPPCYILTDLKSALQVLNKHVKDRLTGNNGKNTQRSRSHFSIILSIFCDSKQIGTLSMHDLAGHESVNHSKNQKETGFINQSLRQIQQILKVIRKNKNNKNIGIKWRSYPLFGVHMKEYLQDSRGIIIATFGSDDDSEEPNRASWRFINEIQG